MKFISGFSSREKLLILCVLPAIILLAAYRFGWMPLSQARADAKAEIAGYLTVIEAVQNRGAQPQMPDPAPAVLAPMATRVTQTADAAGILVRRLEPDADLVRVTLDDAQFDRVIAWISRLETEASLKVVGLEIDRRTAPGTVGARVTLENMQ